MQIGIGLNRRTRTLSGLAAVALAFVVGAGFAASAETKSKTVQTEGKWVKYDPEAKVVVIKVTKASPRSAEEVEIFHP